MVFSLKTQQANELTMCTCDDEVLVRLGPGPDLSREDRSKAAGARSMLDIGGDFEDQFLSDAFKIGPKVLAQHSRLIQELR